VQVIVQLIERDEGFRQTQPVPALTLHGAAVTRLPDSPIVIVASCANSHGYGRSAVLTGRGRRRDQMVP
jgi:hypothetical protein